MPMYVPGMAKRKRQPYVIWDKRTTIVTPVGEVLTPQQQIDKYPAVGIEGIRYIVLFFRVSHNFCIKTDIFV